MISLLSELHNDFDDSLPEYIRYSFSKTRPNFITPSIVLIPVTATIQNIRSIIDNFWSTTIFKLNIIWIVGNYFVFLGE